MVSKNKTMYALYHVDTRTGEAVRYPEDSSPATSKESAEAEAQEARRGQALTSIKYSGWQTFALPEGTISVDSEFLSRLPINGGTAARSSR